MTAASRSPGLPAPLLAATVIAVLTAAAVAGPADAPKPKAKVDYDRDVRPILSDNCYACHGPDAPSRKASLRFDRRESAVAELDDGEHAVVPGKAAESELVRRVSGDDRRRMPPPKTGKRLTPQQIFALRQWIDQGAPYAVHWSFIPPVKAEPPTVADAAWPAAPSTAFILARARGRTACTRRRRPTRPR